MNLAVTQAVDAHRLVRLCLGLEYPQDYGMTYGERLLTGVFIAGVTVAVRPSAGARHEGATVSRVYRSDTRRAPACTPLRPVQRAAIPVADTGLRTEFPRPT